MCQEKINLFTVCAHTHGNFIECPDRSPVSAQACEPNRYVQIVVGWCDECAGHFGEQLFSAGEHHRPVPLRDPWAIAHFWDFKLREGLVKPVAPRCVPAERIDPLRYEEFERAHGLVPFDSTQLDRALTDFAASILYWALDGLSPGTIFFKADRIYKCHCEFQYEGLVKAAADWTMEWAQGWPEDRVGAREGHVRSIHGLVVPGIKRWDEFPVPKIQRLCMPSRPDGFKYRRVLRRRSSSPDFSTTVLGGPVTESPPSSPATEYPGTAADCDSSGVGTQATTPGGPGMPPAEPFPKLVADGRPIDPIALSIVGQETRDFFHQLLDDLEFPSEQELISRGMVPPRTRRGHDNRAMEARPLLNQYCRDHGLPVLFDETDEDTPNWVVYPDDARRYRGKCYDQRLFTSQDEVMRWRFELELRIKSDEQYKRRYGSD